MVTKDVAPQVGGRDGVAPDQWIKMRANDCPLKRIAEPWEMGGVAAFLASEDARYITGQSIEVDGGLIMS
jgi:NAD(P)-dependent dehydrogenase (short-subunit alcohol dehydrogenase family)